MRKPLAIGVRVESTRPRTFEDRLQDIARPLQGMDATQAAQRFELPAGAALLKTTLSLCPECLTHVQAAVYSEGKRVFIAKACATHGFTRALLENDANYYHLSNKDRWGKRYADLPVVHTPAFTPEGDAGGNCCAPGTSCGTPVSGEWNYDSSDQRSNKTCTVLVEVTDACNLACRVCYADSKGDRVLSLDAFRKHVSDLLA